MKKNTHKAIPIVQQAISIIADDASASEARNFLVAALRVLEKVANKKAKKDSLATYYAEKAKLKDQEWWAKIKENTLKFAEIENKNKEANN